MNKHALLTLKMSSVLLVEDNESNREKFSNLLSLYIGKVYQANNGIEGLEIYNTYNPSLIISDIEMSEMDGLTFIQEIRKVDSTIPVIIISGFASKESLLEAVKLSLVNYLLKPIKHYQLILSLSKAAELIKTTQLFGEIKIKENCIYDTSNKRLVIDRKYHRLSKSEIYILELLLSNKNKIVTREMIIAKNNHFEERSLSSYYHIIYSLRKKIGKDLIINISSSGWMLVY